MYLGLFVSVLLHAALLGWTVISIQSTPELRAPTIEPVAVDLISPSDLTKLMKGSRDAKLKEARPNVSDQTDPAPKEGPRPRPIAAPPPPAAEPPPPPPEPEKAPEPPPPPPKAAEAPPPPTPEPPPPQPDKAALEQKLADLALEQAEEAKRQAAAQAKAEAEARANAEAEAKAKADAAAKAKAEADAKAKAEADAKRLAEAKRKAAELKRKQEAKRKADAEKKRLAEAEKAKFSADRLSALLDKSPDQRAPAPAAPATNPDARAKGAVIGAKEGRDQVNSASEIAFIAGLIRQSVIRCNNVIAGREQIDTPVVQIEVRLRPDGSLADAPKVTSSGSNSPIFRDAVDAALRAIVNCAPYALPPDKYEIWGHMRLTFDLSRMN